MTLPQLARIDGVNEMHCGVPGIPTAADVVYPAAAPPATVADLARVVGWTLA